MIEPMETKVGQLRARCTCDVPGCGRARYCRGFCIAHYERVRLTGDLAADRPIGVGRRLHWLRQNCQPGHDECVEWPFSRGDTGYGHVSVNGRASIASREACREAHGEPPSPDMEAAHSCGNRACINGRHLRWDTRKGNHADKAIHGTRQVGEKGPGAKLTNAQVRAIRADPRSRRAVARDYGVTPECISAIVLRKTFKEI